MNCPIFILCDSCENTDEYMTNWMTYRKVCHILDHKELVKKFFMAGHFSESDAIQMLELYNRGSLSAAKQPRHIPLSDLPASAIAKLVDVFNYHRIVTPEITDDDFLSLFSTGMSSRAYTSCGNTEFALFAFCLREYKLISAGWAKTLCSHNMFLTAVGQPMNSKNIANTSYRVKESFRFNLLNDKQTEIIGDLMSVIEDYLNTLGIKK